MAMQSKIGSMTLQAAGSATSVGAFLQVGDGVTVRVYIRNLGGATAILSLDSAAINGPAGLIANPKQMPLPAGLDVTLVLTSRQQLFAIGSGAGVVLAWAVSEALPGVSDRPDHAALP